MATFLYCCPNTGQHVQGWSAEEVQADETTYETVTLPRVPAGLPEAAYAALDADLAQILETQ